MATLLPSVNAGMYAPKVVREGARCRSQRKIVYTSEIERFTTTDDYMVILRGLYDQVEVAESFIMQLDTFCLTLIQKRILIERCVNKQSFRGISKQLGIRLADVHSLCKEAIDIIKRSSTDAS